MTKRERKALVKLLREWAEWDLLPAREWEGREPAGVLPMGYQSGWASWEVECLYDLLQAEAVEQGDLP